MALNWLGDESWTPKILAGAKKDLDELPDPVRREALQMLADLLEDPYPPNLEEARMKGYRNRYRLYFYRDRYRFIYEIAEQQRTVRVLRVRLRDRYTYSGMRKW